MKHLKLFRQRLTLLVVFVFLMNTVLYSQNTNPTIISTPVTTVDENAAYSYNVTATDADGDPITVSATTLPGWLTVTTTATVSTMAGSTAGFTDGTGTAAQFSGPIGTVVDGSGNIYVADLSNYSIRKISPAGVVTTLAGNGSRGFADGTGTTAQFSSPTGVAVDGAGNVYVADTGNHSIRKISPNGVVTTLAGNGTRGFADGTGTVAQFSSPNGVAVDGAGNVYVTDLVNHRIRKISPSGVVTTLAGSSFGFADGTGTAAQFSSPSGIAVDESGNAFVGDSGNHKIRKVSPSGVVTTLAGSSFGFADGTGTVAQFSNPTGVAVDRLGNVYIADRGNHRIRKITPAGVVTTLAGSTEGFADDIGTAAKFNRPRTVTADESGNLYVGDSFNHRIRKITIQTKLTGTPTSVDIGTHNVVLQASDGNGGITSQPFTITVAEDVTAPTITSTSPSDDAMGIAVDSNVTLTFNENILASTGNITIYDASDDAVVETIAAGSANVSVLNEVVTINPTNDLAFNQSYYVQIATTAFKDIANNNFAGISDKTTLSFTAETNAAPTITSSPVTTVNENAPYSYTITTADADGDGVTISAITSPGWLTLATTATTSTLAGSTEGATNGTGTAAQFKQPSGVAVDGSGNVYVADRENNLIRKISPDGVVTTLAGNASGKGGHRDGTGTAAQFNMPYGVAVDDSGNVYVADTDNYSIRKITPTGVVTTLSEIRASEPRGIAVDGAGNIYVANTGNNNIQKITPTGAVTIFAGSGGKGGYRDGTGTAAQFNTPSGVAVDGAGNVYVADAGNHNIRKITPAGVVTTLAGGNRKGGFADGTGVAAEFDFPSGVAVDGAGNVYVADVNNNRVRKITPTGAVTTLAGSTQGSVDGVGTAAQFSALSGVALDASGNLYVGDTFNHRIRKITIQTKLTGTPTSADTGTHNVALRATDSRGSMFTQSFTITVAEDVQAPIVVSTNPSDDATEVAVESDISFTFSENVLRGTGNITIYDASDDSAVETIAVGAANVSVTDKIATINPTNDLMYNKSYYVQIATAAFKDVNNNDFAGISDKTTLSFAVKTNTAPTFTSSPVTTVDENAAYSYTIATADSDEDPVTVNASTLPNWLSIAVTVKNVSTLAGSTQGSADGAGTLAQFDTPEGVALDRSGNIYVADNSNNSIRKISASGVVTTFAGNGSRGSADGIGSAAQFYRPAGLAVDESDNIYVADNFNNSIRKITPTGLVTTLAGGGDGRERFRDGTGTDARFFEPRGIVVDQSGNVYVADSYNNRIRKVSPTGVVTTLAGGNSGYTDGTGTAAQFSYPIGLALDGSGNIYVADRFNHRIRKITPAGVVSTFAGSSRGFVDGTGTAANFYEPYGVALDGSGNVYVADSGNHGIRKITTAGVVTTLAGSTQGSADGAGTAAQFYHPIGIALDGSGNVYVGDTFNHSIRKITTQRVLRGTPTSAEIGTHSVVLEASDGKMGVTDQPFTITVVDPAAPTLVSTSPSDDDTEVAVGSDIAFTFSEDILAGSGDIIIYDTSDDSVVETITVGSANVSITGAVVTINPTNDLTYNKSYYVQVAAGVFKNATNNTFAGILDKTTLSFAAETNVAPTFTSSPVTSVDENAAYSYAITTTDADTDPITVSGTTLPVWLSITTVGAVNTLEGTPTLADIGTHNIVLEISDGKAAPVQQSFMVNVIELDRIAPVLTSSNPVDDALDFNGSTITFTFDEGVLKGSGRISVFDAADDTEITGAGVGSARITVTGNTATFDLINPLPLDRQVYVRIPGGAFKDALNNNFIGLLDNTSLNFATPTIPQLTSSNPVDDAVDVDATTITLTFDRNMFKGTGRISVFDASDDSEISGAGIGSPRVTIASNIVTFDLINALPENKQVYLTVPPSAFKDTNDNFFLGITDKTSLNFATPTTPQLVSSNPLDEAVDVGATLLTFTFDRDIFKGTGRISVFDASDDSEISGAGIGSPRVTIANNIVTFDLINALPENKQVYLRVPPSAFKDTNDNFFLGITDKASLNFATPTTPQLMSSNPLDEAVDVGATLLTFTFDRDILKGTGRISVFDAVDDSEISGAGIGSSRVTIANNVVTFDLVNPLPLNKQVYVRIPASGLKDVNDRFFQGIQDNTTLNFASATSPQLTSTTPIDEASNVVATTLTFTFDRNVFKGSGRISVFDAANDTEINGAGVGSARVSIADNVVSYDLINPLPLDGEFYVRIPGSAFKDVSDVLFQGILDNTTLNFATPTTPKLVSSNPADAAVEFAGTSLVLTFDRNLIKGTGRISIKDVADDSEITGAGVGSSRVVVNNNVVTIDLINPLPLDRQVYVTIPAAAFKDGADLFYKGIQDNTTLNFASQTSPKLVSSTPQDGAIDFTGTTISLTFDRNVIKGSGRISIRDVADDSEITGAGVGSTRIVVAGNVVTIDLINPLPFDKQAYLRIPASAFKDGSDVFYAGILDQTTLNFASPTTPQVTSTNPLDGSTDFSGTVVTFTFDRNVIKGSGRLGIFNAADDTEITGAGVGSTRVTVSGNTVSFNLINALPAGTNAYVKVPASAFKDANDRFYKGILDNTTLNFSTVAPAEVNPQSFDLELTTIDDQRLSVYPNPAVNEINIDLSEMGEEPTVRIVSINGVVKLTEQTVKALMLKVDVSQYAEGIYIVASQDKSGQVVYKKFMIRK